MFALILDLCYNMSGKTNTHIGGNGRRVRFFGAVIADAYGGQTK